MKFIIINLEREMLADERTYWSNEDGWVDVNSATRFDHAEIVKVNLPFLGAWVPDPDFVEDEDPHYGMFSDEGNAAVHTFLMAFPPTKGESWSDYFWRAEFMVTQDGKRQGMDFTEVGDTVVREAIWNFVNHKGNWHYSYDRLEEVYVG